MPHLLHFLIPLYLGPPMHKLTQIHQNHILCELPAKGACCTATLGLHEAGVRTAKFRLMSGYWNVHVRAMVVACTLTRTKKTSIVLCVRGKAHQLNFG